VSAKTTLNSGDQLIFAGDVERLVDLFTIPGIKPTNQVRSTTPARRTHRMWCGNAIDLS
jgi:hypothetical protein